MNPRSRRAALHAIATVAILASLNALTHSYIGLYGWATAHGLTGWQAATWPAEVDVFLIIGELALYVAYLDAWPTRHKAWPWATATVGLAISIAGNVGHVRPSPAETTDLATRLTAATSPLAAFAGLAIGLLVLKLTRSVARERPGAPIHAATLLLLGKLSARRSIDSPNEDTATGRETSGPAHAAEPEHPELRLGASENARRPIDVSPRSHAKSLPCVDQSPIYHDAREILRNADAKGTRLTQRTLASQLRQRGHRVSNANLKHISAAIDPP